MPSIFSYIKRLNGFIEFSNTNSKCLENIKPDVTLIFPPCLKETGTVPAGVPSLVSYLKKKGYNPLAIDGDMIYKKNLMVYKSILAKDVMTPFSVAVTAEENISIQQFYNQHKNLKFSRIPIYKDRPNNITGFILKDDFLEEIINDHGDQPLSSLKRELLITQAQTSIQHLFNILIEKRAHIAVVTDEFGNTVGVITMEDLIETLLGLEIMDESDSIADMQHLARKNWERRAKRLGIISHPEESEEKPSTNSDEKSTS